MIWMLAISASLAGSLAQGWRGHPYGDATWLATAPGPACVAKPENQVEWRCREAVGDVEVEVAYMVYNDIYVGVGVRCRGFDACLALRRVIEAAWGTPASVETYGPLPRTIWRVAPAAASWRYNQYTSEGVVYATDLDAYARAEQVSKEAARKAADGI